MSFGPTSITIDKVDGEITEFTVVFDFSIKVSGFKMTPYVRDAGLVRWKSRKLSWPDNLAIMNPWKDDIEREIVKKFDEEVTHAGEKVV